MDIKRLRELLPQLLPEATQWAEQIEQMVILQGFKLDEALLKDAQQVGVVYSGKIVILEVETFPKPENPILQQAASAFNLLGENTAGLALGYAILVKQGLLSRRLVSHECRHVYQYEQAGSMAAFLQGYLSSVLEHGYFDSPYEQDARQHELAD